MTRHRASHAPPAATGETMAAISARYSDVVDQLPDTILIVTDRDLRYVLIAGGGLERTGWRAGEVLGRQPRDIMPPHVRAPVEEHMVAALHGETTSITTLQDSRAGLIWEAHFAPVRVQDGAITGVILLLRDVTDEHHLTEQLHESTNRFRTTVDALLDNVALFSAIRDESGTIIDLRWEYANPATCATTSKTLDELQGRRLSDVLPTVPETELYARFVHTIETGEPLLLELQGFIADTVSGSFDVRGAKLGDGLVVTARDISGRVRSEERLRESEERYRVMIDSAASGVGSLAEDGRFLKVNQRFCQITGYSEHELLTHAFRDIIHADDRQEHLAQVQRLMAAKIPWYSAPRRCVRKDGSVVWLLVTGASLRDESGAAHEYIITATDITAERQAQEEVTHLNAELEARVQRRTTELQGALATVESQKVRAESMQRFQTSVAKVSRIEQVCEISLTAMADELQADAGTMYVLDEDSGAIVLQASRGVNRDRVRPVVVPGEGLAGRAIAEKRPVTASYPGTAMRVTGLATDHDVRHELHVPLLHRDAAIGVVSLGHWQDAGFGDDEIAAATWMCERSATACREALGLRRVETIARERQDLMDATDEGIYRLDQQSRITFINRAALELTGYQEDELLGENAHDILHHHKPGGEPFPSAECPISRTANSGQSVRLPNEAYWRKDGSSFPVEVSTNPVYSAGKITGSMVTFLDTTRRRLAERELSAQFRASRFLAAAISVPGALREVLEATCDELGWEIALAWRPDPSSPRPLIAATFSRPGLEATVARLTEAGAPPADSAAARAWTRRETVFSPGVVQTGLPPTEPATPPLVADLAVPALGSAGEVIVICELLGYREEVSRRMTETVEAVTAQLGQYIERKQAEESSVRAKDEFVATVSHDLRAPLTAINAWLELLLDGRPGPLTDGQRDSLKTIKNNSDRLMLMINDLLVLGQLDMGLPQEELADLDVSSVASETADLFRPAAAERGIELTLETEPVVIHGDESRITQLISNLLSNALKFTADGGHVGARVSRYNGSCRIEVTDTGIGVPEAERVHLFERFYRGSNAREDDIHGTGLGLAICQGITTAHNGTIELARTSDRGSTFRVELPAKDTADL